MKDQIIKKYRKLKNDIKSIKDQMNNFDVADHYDEDEYYNEHLDSFGSVFISGGGEYEELRILREIDPIAFRQLYLDHCNAMEKVNIPAYIELQEEAESLEFELEDLESELEEQE